MMGARLIAETVHGYGLTHAFFMPYIIPRALGEMQNGSTQKIGVGYHLPSAPHQLMLHKPLVQLRTDEGTVQADTGFAFADFFAANEGVADTIIAPAASVAANTHFAIVLIMGSPRFCSYGIKNCISVFLSQAAGYLIQPYLAGSSDAARNYKLEKIKAASGRNCAADR